MICLGNHKSMLSRVTASTRLPNARLLVAIELNKNIKMMILPLPINLFRVLSIEDEVMLVGAHQIYFCGNCRRGVGSEL